MTLPEGFPNKLLALKYAEVRVEFMPVFFRPKAPRTFGRKKRALLILGPSQDILGCTELKSRMNDDTVKIQADRDLTLGFAIFSDVMR
jgi:hypothetical protein